MKRESLFLLFLIGCFTVTSCQEDPEPADPPGPPLPSGDFETRDIQIDLPAGSSFDFGGSELLSYGEFFPVGGGGKTGAVSTPGSPSVAYLFDASGRLVLAGPISDGTSSLSPQSTANVLLTYALGASLREEGFVPLFWEQVNSLPEAIAWQERFTELWKSDPLILEKGTYAAALREVMEKLVPEARVIDIRANAKISDISVDHGDLKSGIQVFDDGLGQFSVNNRYRRRAHGFLYKMSYKDNNGQSHQILSAVGPASPSDRDFAVSPTAAATSVIGVLGSAIEGNQGDVAEVKSGPFKLDLEEMESEATYKLHVIGPGRPLQMPVTEAERSKHERLTIETFVIDFMFPLIMEIYGWKDDLLKQKIDIGSGPIERFIGATEVFLKAAPEVYETVKSGDYLGASKKAVELLYTGAVEGNLENLSVLAFDVMADVATSAGLKIPASASAEKIVGRGAKILQVINTAMLAGDFIRISDGIESSRNMEDWTIRARSTQVTLLPKEATVRSRGSKEITAEVKNLEEQGDTHPYFVWKTSGKYGYIQDTKGNRGESFDSSDPKVTYYSTTSANLLEQENNWEYVYVEAFLGSQSLGKDTVKLNLRKSVYEIKPNGVTLSGKEGSANNAKLHIEPTDGSVMDFSDKKVVWTTGGQHGKLKGPGGFSTTITSFGDNSIHYECTDKDTKQATEKVYARIYAKSAVGDDYFLYEELEATININNEDNIIIKYVSISVVQWGPEEVGVYTNCGAGTIFYIDPEPNAESYTATVIEFGPEVIPRVTGTTRTWSANAATNADGQYEFAYILAAAGSSPTWIGPPDCGKFIAGAAARKGTARVIIRLKN